MSRGRFVWDDKHKTFVEGKASPELLPQHMRSLPSSYVTKDAAEGDKVHPDDPEHVVKTLISDQQKKEAEVPKPEMPLAVQALAESLVPLGVKVPLSQRRIDVVRFRIIKARVDRMAKTGALDTSIVFVWFPEDNVNRYELRKTLPRKLPRHLRHYKLAIDVFNWPQSIIDALESLGYKYDVQEMIHAAQARFAVSQEVRDSEARELQSIRQDN